MESSGYGQGRGVVRRLTTETKQAFKTTEFWAYVLVVLGVLIAGTVDDSEGSQFGADDVWLYVALLTIGYMVARGLAKSGGSDPYWDHPETGDGNSLGERVKTAAQVLKEGDTSAQAGTQRAGSQQDRY
jgi:hypothetical protein